MPKARPSVSDVEAKTVNQSFSVPRGRLMLCNIGRVGDTILRNSILDSAFRTYATVDYICGRHNAELITNDSRFHRVTVFRNSPSGFAGLLWAALSHRYDGYIDLRDHSSRTSLMIARLFRSRLKAGCNRDHFRPFNRDTHMVESGPPRHVVEKTRQIGQVAGLASGEYRATMVLTRNSVEWFRKNYAWNKPFIFLNVSATHVSRMWLTTGWARYVQGCGLACEPVLVNGLPRHQDMVRELCRALPGAHAFQPKSFMDCAAAVADARLVLTVNTGVVHACSALDKPVVALFSADNTPVEFEPLSSWRLVIKPRAGKTVTDIDPEDAIAETRRRSLP